MKFIAVSDERQKEDLSGYNYMLEVRVKSELAVENGYNFRSILKGFATLR